MTVPNPSSTNGFQTNGSSSQASSEVREGVRGGQTSNNGIAYANGNTRATNGTHRNGEISTNNGNHVNGNGHASDRRELNGNTSNGNTNGHVVDRDYTQINSSSYRGPFSKPDGAHAATSGLNGHSAPVNGHSVNGTNGDHGSSSSGQCPIAICGMAMRLPGGIGNGEDLWDALYNGKDLRTPIPPKRYNAGAFGNALGKKSAIKTQHGYFLDDDLSHLDASFFSMTQTDLERTDPQQRMILEVTRECLENSGEVDWRGKPIGCYVGTFGEDWLHSMSKENQFTGAFAASGDLMIANRVSYEFDFKGPR